MASEIRQVTRRNVAHIACWADAEGYWPPTMGNPCVWFSRGDEEVRALPGDWVVKDIETGATSIRRRWRWPWQPR